MSRKRSIRGRDIRQQMRKGGDAKDEENRDEKID